MRTTIKIIGIFLLSFASLQCQQSEKRTLELSSSQINWTGYGAIGGYSLSGTLNFAQDSFLIFEADRLVAGTLVFDMKSIAHENKQLVRHLKDKDFFEVKKYAQARFKIEDVNEGKIKGKLTIKGITKTIEVPFEESTDAVGKKINGEIAVDRTQFGINYNSDSFFKNLGSNAIKDKFDVKFSLQLNR